ncbi:DUF2130 domain-containing protein [Nereida sp. MMG025]|uniref:DUF2130 domain-containing protein n=1 Tax=Nereida sp. MMG025 TaxID=2909981 RepID=UPI001F311686|nr:DUF2130 domain-containing protein [Nereida sp. MMG025]MCF6445622.1 DUF2130 domain-containing protein [Nereida sp. MMG025]
MADLKITCPTCSSEIELTEQLAGPLVADLTAKFQAQIAAKEEATKRAVAEAEARAKEAGKSEASEMQAALKAQVDAQKKKLEAAAKEQLEAMKLKEALEEKERELELTVQRKLAEERIALEAKAKLVAEEAAGLKVAEKDQMIEGMKRQIEALKQKSEQGSMQTQGEAAEIVLEDALAQAFAMDDFAPVPKGVSGADVQQNVRDGQGAVAGRILWESKRTKNWTAGWLAKLRNDQRAAGCEVAVLTSTALPDGVESFAQVDGIWVCAPRYAVALGRVLRQGLLDVAVTKGLQVGQQTKQELIFEYFTGTQFKQRIEAVVERFVAMEEALRKERTFMEKSWATRAKQMELVQASMLGLHGDLQGIAGQVMPQIDGMDEGLLE